MFKSFKLKNIIIKNRAPFDDINLELNENINILTGINGTGKTTILTYIVDSLYELAKKEYYNEFRGKETDLYRISSDLYIKDITKEFSIVYLRYSLDDKNFDYIDIRGSISEDEYNTIINLENKIDYRNFEKILQLNRFIKEWNNISKEDIREIFEKNIAVYFPSYRFEPPTYLNSTYKPIPKFNMSDIFQGKMPNRIEVDSSIQDIANWLMDVMLDDANECDNIDNIIKNKFILRSINDIIEKIFSGKFDDNQKVSLVVKNRRYKYKQARLEINNGNKVLIPSIFNMSDGELSLFCIFSEIFRQLDEILPVIFNNIDYGIVLIDEIDKNLHIKMQTEILPSLLNMFPNIQFILTSHSPFIPLGLENNKMPYCSFIMDTKDIRRLESLESMELYNEVYTLFIEENVNYKKKLEDFEKKIKDENKIMIMTEGKTDIKHLKVALEMLAKKEDKKGEEYKKLLENIKFDEDEENDKKGFGDKNLLKNLISISNLAINTKIIGIFDRDNFDELLNVDKNIPGKLKTEKYLNLDKNIYIFSIPLGENENEYKLGEIENEYKTKFISIEHYYKRKDLKREDEDEDEDEDGNKRRLYLQEEFYMDGAGKKEEIRTENILVTKWNEKLKKIKKDKNLTKEAKEKKLEECNKKWEEYNKVIYDEVYKNDDHSLENIALSKDAFAKLIEKNKETVDFSRFRYIFDIILKIKEEIDKKEEQKIQK